MKESKEKAKSVFGGLFGKVSMYDDKEGVVVFDGTNPKCFFDITVCTANGSMPCYGRTFYLVCSCLLEATLLGLFFLVEFAFFLSDEDD